MRGYPALFIVALTCAGGTACELVAGIHDLTLGDAGVLSDATHPPGDPPDQVAQPLPDATGDSGDVEEDFDAGVGSVEASADSGDEAAVDSSVEAAIESGVDAGVDSGGGSARGDASTEAGVDSGILDSGSDAPPPLYFGADCPAGTVYTDPFDFDPVASGNWTLIAGSYTFDAANHAVTLVAGSTLNGQMWIGPRPAWTNYTVSVPVTLNANGNGGVNFRMENTPDPAPNDSGHMYLAGLWATGVQLSAETGGDASTFTSLATAAGTFSPTTSYVFQASVSGQAMKVNINGIQFVTDTDTTFNLAHGAIGLHSYKSSLTFGPVTVTCN
jgi:hypothetical protein